MNKKLLKPIITSGLLALAFGAIGTGATFALFTDNAEAEINIAAGKVAMSLTPEALTTYSAEANADGDRIDERGSKYISKLTTVQGVFTNGGTAAYADGVFTLDKITPGDRVTFTATLANASTVNIKYRLVYVLDSTDTKLATGLVTKMDLSGTTETYAGLKTFRSEWIALAANASPEKASFSFDIELPIDKGNEYQEKTARFSLYAEAVQGNADVENDPVVELLEEDFSGKETAEAGEPTVVEAENEAGDIGVKTTIPADAAEVAPGSEVTLEVSKLVVTSDPETDSATLNFDISLYIDGTKQSTFAGDPIKVEIYVGPFLEITEVVHDSVTLDPSDYTYDASTGVITFYTNDFSPFSVSYVHMDRNTMYGFYDSYVEEGHWVHIVKDKAHFRNIMDHIKACGSLSAADTFNHGTVEYPLADKTSEYRIIEDIDFGGRIWTTTEIGEQVPFTGKLVSGKATNVVLSNVELATHLNIVDGGADWNACGGLFNVALDATFEGITLDRFILNASNGKGCGLFLAGQSSGLVPVYSLSFIDCVINSTCVMNVSANSGSFMGSSRGISNVSFIRCTNNADVLGTSTNMGGFVGTGTTKATNTTNNLTFTNCTNNGAVMGSDFVGGFTGNTTDTGRVLVGSGNVQNGPVYVTTTGTNYGLFHGKFAYNGDSHFAGNITDNAHIYAGTNGGGHEKNNMGSLLTITHGETAVTSENYADYVTEYHLVNLNASFDANDKMIFGNSVEADRVVVNIRSHGLRISKTRYWPNVDEQGQPFPGQTNEYGGALQSETEPYVGSALVFDSLAEVDVTKVTMEGYFIPAGANAPHASYNAGFNTFLLDNSLLEDPDYTDGYHQENGVAWIVARNDAPSSDQYLAICDWRNRVSYEINAFKDGALVGTSKVEWGRGSGDATLLLPISFN